MRKRTITLLAVLLSILVAGQVCARDESIVLGGPYGWGAGAHTNGLVHAGDALSLMPRRHDPGEQTELLLHFDSLPLADSSGNFEVAASSPELSRATRRSGVASLLVDDPADEVTLSPRSSILFASGTEWGSFTLEFWLYPVTISQGETVLEWSGREGSALDFRSQRVRVDILDRRLRFSFENFFQPPDQSEYAVELTGHSGLIPRTWSHHQITFDAQSARMEYRVDGQTVDVTHISASGTEDGTVFYPRTASIPSESLTLVPSFTGAIDELRLERRLVDAAGEAERLQWYETTGGWYESAVLDLGSPGAVLTNVTAKARTPGMTDVFLYVRVHDQHQGGVSVPGEWLPVDPDERIEPKRGRFVQLRAELLPDPAIPESPVLSRIEVTYTPDPAPYPPVGLRVVPGDGEVELSWAPVLEEDILGYMVYYGTHPGRYTGTGADSGPSPVDAGPATALTLSGLDNGTLYYFAVGAYDAAGVYSSSELSAEVAARPAKVYR